MTQIKGVVAAGHEQTAKAAEHILQAGGNAFDAVIAAHLTACVAEPVLSSLAGGGFLLAHQANGQTLLYDFFVQTPGRQCKVSDTDFYPISADFGKMQQEFHIGTGSIATPGTVKGLYEIHRDLGSIPLKTLFEPAIELARNGLQVNTFQAYLFDIVKAIYSSHPETQKIYTSEIHENKLLTAGEFLQQTDLADFMECLAIEGEALFYRGEIAQSIDHICSTSGGHLTLEDFKHYQIERRKPLNTKYRQASLFSNPAPSSGGTLITFALQLLEAVELGQYSFGSAAYLELLTRIQSITDKARMDASRDTASLSADEYLLNPEAVAQYRKQIQPHAFSSRGTTHISVMDQAGNMASLTTSNGEGCGIIIPKTGIMLNNMLGEQDLNPRGFHCWTPNQRMTSMMAPSIVFMPGNQQVVLGSGGSNRLRTAILQVLLNLIDFDMPLEQAVNSPRIHFEKNHLTVEGGFDQKAVEQLTKNFTDHKVLESRNLFFGGTHSICSHAGKFSCAGDPRRGGHAMVVGK